MKNIKARIISNIEISPGFYRMRIESRYLAGASKPGQFLEVRCSDSIDVLLRRPLGVHRIGPDWIEMLYEVVGKGTELLSRKAKGSQVDVIGPLGNGFDIPSSLKAAILVAGGVGAAPIMALAEELAETGRKVSVVIGAKKKTHVLCEKDFKKLGFTVRVATEDGSKGYKGLVTDLLQGILTASHAPRLTIYACGPAGMLKAVAKIAEDKGIPCSVSLEERMACGVGVCLSCPVKVKAGGYKMVCKDGPVFDAEEIAW